MEKLMEEAKWEYVGDAAVDAGLIMIADPCYWIEDREQWKAFCRRMDGDDVFSPPLDKVCIPFEAGHLGKGVAFSSGYGDGSYPVSIIRNEEGRIAGAFIQFADLPEGTTVPLWASDPEEG